MEKYLTKAELAAMLKMNSGLSNNQIKEVVKKTPESEIEIRKDENGIKFKSVKGSYIKKKLTLIFGFCWSFEVTSSQYIKECRETVVKGRLSITLSNGNVVVREQFGRHYLSVKKGAKMVYNIGDGYKSAATDALKKCASEFGVCWDIYSQDVEKPKEEKAPSEEDKRVIAFINKAKNLEELEVTVSQIEENVEISKFQEIIDKKVTELSQKQVK